MREVASSCATVMKTSHPLCVMKEIVSFKSHASNWEHLPLVSNLKFEFHARMANALMLRGVVYSTNDPTHSTESRDAARGNYDFLSVLFLCHLSQSTVWANCNVYSKDIATNIFCLTISRSPLALYAQDFETAERIVDLGTCWCLLDMSSRCFSRRSALHR